MVGHATVSATFAHLNAAEAAIASLLRIGLRGPEVVLTRTPGAPSYVVTVAADERVRDVEEVMRACSPLQWRTSIHDGHEAAGPGGAGFIHFAPEADRLEQESAWLSDTSPTAAGHALESGSEADWIEQAQPVYETQSEMRGPKHHADGSEADYAEQMIRAFHEPPDDGGDG